MSLRHGLGSATKPRLILASLRVKLKDYSSLAIRTGHERFAAPAFGWVGNAFAVELWRKAAFVVRMGRIREVHMAWLWDSWEEYVDIVRPVAVDSPQRVRLSHRDSWFEVEHLLCKAVHNLEEKSHALYRLGFRSSEDAAPAYDQDS
jgi:hypothetical protein